MFETRFVFDFRTRRFRWLKLSPNRYFSKCRQYLMNVTYISVRLWIIFWCLDLEVRLPSRLTDISQETKWTNTSSRLLAICMMTCMLRTERPGTYWRAWCTGLPPWSFVAGGPPRATRARLTWRTLTQREARNRDHCGRPNFGHSQVSKSVNYQSLRTLPT